MVRVEFQLTEADYQEATLGRPPEKGRLLRAALGAALVSAFPAILALPYVLSDGAAATTSAAGVADSPAGRVAQVARVAAPAAVWLALSLGLGLASTFGKVAAPWRPPVRSAWRSVGKTLVATACLLVLFGSVALERTPYEAALVVVPTVTGTALLSALGVCQIARSARRGWRAQPHLHRPTTLETSPDGDRLVFAHAVARQEYAWAAIVGYREVPNLLLLYLSPLSYWVVPKRAFADAAELGRFRLTLADRVPEGILLPQREGFAVLPPATVGAHTVDNTATIPAR